MAEYPDRGPDHAPQVVNGKLCFRLRNVACGPYESKAEAQSDYIVVKKFFTRWEK